MSPRGIEAMEALNSLNAAARQLDFTSNQWLDDSVKSLARLRVLIVLLAGEGQPVAHQEIINALQVKRATVSGLMAALERDGFVKSAGDTGACQGTCRLSHAAKGCLSVACEAIVTTDSRSGLRVTAPTGVQSRVQRDQRAGLRSRARTYTS
jgi:predicted transcriptional regulator